MRNILMLFLILSFLSCEKESGFIPEPGLNDPYYAALEPELQWRANMPLIVISNYYQIMDDLIIIYGARENSSQDETIRAYDLESGNLIWELDISNLLHASHIRGFHILKEGQTLYFIDLYGGKTFLINAENGNLIEMRTLNGVNTFNTFKAYIKDQSYYHLDYKRDERLLTLIKYDVTQHEVEEVMDLSGYPIINSVSQAVYHESENILYLHANIDHQKVILLALDLNTKEFHELWSKSDSVNYVQFHSEHLLLVDDNLIFDNGHGEINAINRISGKVEWVFKKAGNIRANNIFIHMGNVYILLAEKLIAIDHQTGEIKWVNFDPNILSGISVHPDEALLIARTNNEASIYDLTSGQKLVEWHAAPNEDGKNSPVVFTTYHGETNSIYLGTTDELMKYNWPLP